MTPLRAALAELVAAFDAMLSSGPADMSDADIDQMGAALDHQFESALAAARSALSVAPAFEPGWKLVPVEPTDAMRGAYAQAYNADDQHQSSCYEERFAAGTAGTKYSWLAGYKAMLAAAPTVPDPSIDSRES